MIHFSQFLLFAAFLFIFLKLHGDRFDIFGLIVILFIKLCGLLGLFKFEIIFLGRLVFFFIFLIFLDLLHKAVNDLSFGERSLGDLKVIEFNWFLYIDGKDGLRLDLVVLSCDTGAHYNG